MLTDQQIDEFLEMLAKSPTSARDMVRWLFAAHEAKAEPFGYFRAEPMGWTDCAATDEGAIALYERPAAPAVPKCVVVDRGFRWESEALQHVPRLVIEFEPVPINSPINAKGWMDRDALADMLAASSQEPAAPSQPMTDEEKQALVYEKLYACLHCGATSQEPAVPQGEPIATVVDNFQYPGVSNELDTSLPIGTKVYAAPSQPAVPDDAMSILRAIHRRPSDAGIWLDDITRLLRNSQAPSQPVTVTDDEMWSLWNSQGIDEMNQSEAIAFARVVIAAHEAKAAPAVPDADELESALERLVERCNTDQFLSNDDAVIHAEATLKRIYKSRKSTATPAAPSQPMTDEEKQALVYEKLYACLHCGAPSQESDDCRKRPRCGLADPCAWTTKREPSQPVTLTDEDIDKLARKHAGDPSCSGAWGSTYEFVPSELRAFVNDIAALREKEQTK